MGKSKNKVAKKALLLNIKTTLLKELKKSTSEIVKNSKKLDKLINKEAKRLVKRLSKKLKTNKSVLKSIDRPSVPREAASSFNKPEVTVSKRVRTRPSVKVASQVTSTAISNKRSAVQGVRKTPASPKAKVTK